MKKNISKLVKNKKHISGIIIITIISTIIVYIIRNLYKKLVKNEAYIFNIHNKMVDILKNMKQIDHKNMFESDDEVGIIFNKLKQIIYQIENYLPVNSQKK